jgi:hypothetical protein
MHRSIATAAVAGLITVGLSSAVHADGAYHTERISLHAVEEAPLRSGSVINIHVNGPRIYAQERYQLNGAEPGHTYQVVLEVHQGDPDCSEPFTFPIPTTSITTNGAGNGHARAQFTPADIGPLAGSGAHGVNWVLWHGDTPVYETGCDDVYLD